MKESLGKVGEDERSRGFRSEEMTQVNGEAS